MTRLLLFFLIITGFEFSSGDARQLEGAPQPLRIYRAEGIIVKAYDFKSLQYFLSKKTDTTYVVNFWATWCAPCVAELRHFEKLQLDNKARKVKVLLVSLDMKKQVETKLIPFIAKKGLASEVVFLDDPNANEWIGKVSKDWSGAIPATLIYNKDERKFFERSFSYASLENELKQFKY
ncbi:MAG: hypothetical protein CFE23_12765 [Flavobacterium sp. BFFFF1]|uniref:TlpA family protein disulfide reductase n=1 Tax=Flavobacterium sp. BFFFF1 TaxID=2015557 RepID=UPI000BD5AFFA|nr:TlpA disulfide reductase family protein [Flavobacterium sp. BFFFF1]OYU79666.1 MAG: hypothetical protein CFE23_12765 [Flavobacterium sp. BFFFF1]